MSWTNPPDPDRQLPPDLDRLSINDRWIVVTNIANKLARRYVEELTEALQDISGQSADAVHALLLSGRQMVMSATALGMDTSTEPETVKELVTNMLEEIGADVRALRIESIDETSPLPESAIEMLRRMRIDPSKVKVLIRGNGQVILGLATDD